MPPSLCSRLIPRASKIISKSNGVGSVVYGAGRRGMADVANSDMTLPLKGIKVLDMTRVLAGVWSF